MPLKNRFLLFALVSAFGAGVTAQDMEPRAYSRAPIGTQTVVAIYGYQTGEVLTDTASPLQDVEVKLNSASLGYARTFGLFGKQANVGVFVPYVRGTVSGSVFENQMEVTRSGLADTRVRMSTMLRGAPALSPKEFMAYKPKTVVGASLTVIVPTGQYDPRRLVNIGSNRWGFKPEIGVSKPIGRWHLEGAAGVWLFTRNNNYFGGVRREQRPLFSLQGHVVYSFKPRMWLSAGGTYFSGGTTVVNNVRNPDRQSNSRAGVTFAYPFGKHQSVKFAVLHGVTARAGGNISTFSVGWQYTWF